MLQAWARLSLLQRFTIASAAIAVALAVVLSSVAVEAIHAFAVKDEAQVAAETVLRTFSPQLRPADFRDSLPPARKVLLDALFRARGVSDKILRVRLWRADGRLLYSNTVEPQAVLTGSANLSTDSGYRAFVLQRKGVDEPAPGVARVFVPVQVAGSPQTLGAFEIFYDMTLLQQRLDRIRRIIWTAVPFGHFLLYASVFVLVSRASRQLMKHQADLIAAHLGTYNALARAIDAKDSYTGDHSEMVARVAVEVGRTMGQDEETLNQTRMAGRLHDLGKIGVPDAILMKQGPLSPQEHVVMRRHAEAGSAILKDAPMPEQVKSAVRHVHERWDGRGYPDGLSGEAIPVIARIIAVVDAYEAMVDNRPYRQGVSGREAMALLRVGAGAQFDPHVVEIFARVVPLPGADADSGRPAPPSSVTAG